MRTSITALSGRVIAARLRRWEAVSIGPSTTCGVHIRVYVDPGRSGAGIAYVSTTTGVAEGGATTGTVQQPLDKLSACAPGFGMAGPSRTPYASQATFFDRIWLTTRVDASCLRSKTATTWSSSYRSIPRIHKVAVGMRSGKRWSRMYARALAPWPLGTNSVLIEKRQMELVPASLLAVMEKPLC